MDIVVYVPFTLVTVLAGIFFSVIGLIGTGLMMTGTDWECKGNSTLKISDGIYLLALSVMIGNDKISLIEKRSDCSFSIMPLHNLHNSFEYLKLMRTG